MGRYTTAISLGRSLQTSPEGDDKFLIATDAGYRTMRAADIGQDFVNHALNNLRTIKQLQQNKQLSL